MAYLDENGLAHFWAKVKSYVAANSAGGVTLNAVYPVGSIYMSANGTSPATLFGGTWEQLKDRFLLAAGDSYAAGATGGSADAIVVSHTHTADAHSHGFTTDSAGDHTHSGTANSAGAHTHKTGHKRVDAYGTGEADAVHFSGAFDVTSSSAGAHSHGLTIGSAGTHTHTGTTESASVTISATGSDGAGANMPPYTAVYVWKRTA